MPEVYPAACGVHFRFGAGVYVEPGGRITLLACEKNAGGKGNLGANYFVLSL